MVSESEPHTLAEAEVIARAVSPLNWWAGEVMAEYDRMRAELAEAQATIARLHGLLNDREYELAVAKAAVGRLEDDVSEWRTIVEAATALRDYDAQFAYPGDEWVSKREQLVRAVVTAVEEGQRT